jgi:hypothetical protein
MFTYVCLGTNDLTRATLFYDATLAALGLQRALWVCKPFNEQAATAGNGTMVALIARSWKAVDDFHAAALANGGSSEGGARGKGLPLGQVLQRAELTR